MPASLTTYLFETGNLLQNPSAPTQLYDTTSLTTYINQARAQVAAEGECIRVLVPWSVTATGGIEDYSFASMTGLGTGIASVLHVRSIWVTTNRLYVAPRSFPWFSVYYLNGSIATSANPSEWTQYGQGANGSVYFHPFLTGGSHLFYVDTVCLPADLTSGLDPEAIPDIWTDAVPFLAAWYALLSSQTSARQADADRMMQRYEDFMARARRGATPDILPDQYDQAPSPVRANQLGLAPQRGGGGGQQQAPQ